LLRKLNQWAILKDEDRKEIGELSSVFKKLKPADKHYHANRVFFQPEQILDNLLLKDRK
jgi:hypothetical protein